MKLVRNTIYKTTKVKKNSIYLHKHSGIPAEKVLSPETLDILDPQEFFSVQRANLRLPQNVRRSSMWH